MEGNEGRYGGDDVCITGNKRRCDVGDREVGNAEHDEIIKRIPGDGGKTLQGHFQNLTNLDDSTRILFIFHNLSSMGRITCTFTIAFTVSSWFSYSDGEWRRLVIKE